MLDFSTRLRFPQRHNPGAWWVVRSRLAQAREKIDAWMLTLTSDDSVLAHLSAAEVAKLWKGRDDVWYKPYGHAADYEKHARDYLAWEVALAEQIKREPAIRFRKY